MRWQARYPGGGVRASRDENGREEIEISLLELEKHFKDELVANLARCLAGCDRLASLAYLAHMNQGLPDSLVKERNLYTLAMFTLGTMHEIAVALDALRRSGIEGSLRETSNWQRLDTIRRRWLGETARTYRCGIAFHLCYKTEKAVEGLRKVRERSNRIVVAAYEAPTRLVDGRHPLGDEVLLAAADIDLTASREAIRHAATDSAELTTLLQAVLMDMLWTCGARVEVPTPVAHEESESG